MTFSQMGFSLRLRGIIYLLRDVMKHKFCTQSVFTSRTEGYEMLAQAFIEQQNVRLCRSNSSSEVPVNSLNLEIV